MLKRRINKGFHQSPSADPGAADQRANQKSARGIGKFQTNHFVSSCARKTASVTGLSGPFRVDVLHNPSAFWKTLSL
jgi:hypothetical protein